MWLRILHYLGFTNLSDKQVRLYEKQKLNEKIVKREQKEKQKETEKAILRRPLNFGVVFRKLALTFSFLLKGNSKIE